MSNTKNPRNSHATPKGEALRKGCPFLATVKEKEQLEDTPPAMICSRSGTTLDGKERGYNCYHCVHFPVVNKIP